MTELLIARLRAYCATVDAIALVGVPPAVARVLADANLPPVLRHGDDPVLAGLPWDTAPGLKVERGAATPSDTAGFSRARCAIADLGTVMLCSGPDNPVTLGFLPEIHLVLLDRADIVATLEEALQRAPDRSLKTPLPRTVNLISGASRTGDIGGRLVMGAHGPRRLHVFITGGT